MTATQLSGTKRLQGRLGSAMVAIDCLHDASIDVLKTGMEAPTFSVEMSQAANLLVIRYRDGVTAAAVARCAERVRDCVEELQPGFQLLVDLSELTSMELASIPHLEEIMELCNGKGVSAVVRVIPDPKRDIGLQILSHFHYAPGVHIATCTSLDEAMTRLA